MITSAKTFARYTGRIGTTVLAEVRAISGLPTRLQIPFIALAQLHRSKGSLE